MKFILWNTQRDGKLRYPTEDHHSGVLGRITADNVYLSTYAEYPEEAKSLNDLAAGEAIENVRFRLSGESGLYDVYRVE